MKRSALKRKTQLKRSGKGLSGGASDGLTRGNGLKRGKPRPTPRGALTPSEWRAEVFRRSHGFCVVEKTLKADHAHHVLSRQQLRKDGREDLTWEPLNGIALCRRVHFDHEHAGRKLERSAIPRETIDWLEGIGYGWYLDRYYA